MATVANFIFKTELSLEAFRLNFLLVIVLSFSFLQMVAWFIQPDSILLTFGSGDATIKFGTAFCLFLSALAGVMKELHHKTFLVGCILTTCVFLMSSIALDQPPSFFPSFEDESAVLSALKDTPSLMTIFSILLYQAGLLRLLKKKIIFTLLIAIGCSAMLGNATGIYAFAFYIEGISSAMAFPTALMLLHLAAWLYFFDKKKINN